MEATKAEAEAVACRARWGELRGQAMLRLVLGQRFGLTPAECIEAIANPSLIRDLAGVLLARRELRDGMLTDVDMHGADCRGALLSKVLLQGAKADLASFDHARLDDVFFWKSTANAASFERAMMNRVTFEETQLAKATFAGAVLQGVRFHWLDLSGCNFDGTRFVDCNFFDVRIDLRHRRWLEGMGRHACRLSRVAWVEDRAQPVV